MFLWVPVFIQHQFYSKMIFFFGSNLRNWMIDFFCSTISIEFGKSNLWFVFCTTAKKKKRKQNTSMYKGSIKIQTRTFEYHYRCPIGSGLIQYNITSTHTIPTNEQIKNTVWKIRKVKRIFPENRKYKLENKRIEGVGRRV